MPTIIRTLVNPQEMMPNWMKLIFKFQVSQKITDIILIHQNSKIPLKVNAKIALQPEFNKADHVL